MKQKDFIKLVIDLRENQKAYYATHDPEILAKCQELDQQIEQAIAAYRNPNKQTTLF